MYESPINLIYGDFQTKVSENNDKMILEAIQKVGVDVDKDELIRALNYDREQYEKGYAEGRNAEYKKRDDLLWDIRNQITMLPIFNRENVIAVIDSHLKQEGVET